MSWRLVVSNVDDAVGGGLVCGVVPRPGYNRNHPATKGIQDLFAHVAMATRVLKSQEELVFADEMEELRSVP